MVIFLKLILLLFRGGLHYNLWVMAYKISWYPAFWMKSWENSWAMAQVHLFLVCVNPTKEQTNDFLVVHLFIIPTIFFYFVPKIWMLWEQNWELVNKKFYILILSLQEIPICEGCEFFPIGCNIIGHSQRRLMNLNFNHGRGNSHFLGILLYPWLQVISILQKKVMK
jgi:hypothetical protein